MFKKDSSDSHRYLLVQHPVEVIVDGGVPSQVAQQRLALAALHSVPLKK